MCVCVCGGKDEGARACARFTLAKPGCGAQVRACVEGGGGGGLEPVLVQVSTLGLSEG